MQRISGKTLGLIGFAAMGLAAFGQDPMPQPQTAPTGHQTSPARREAMQHLTADFNNAVKNGSLSPDDHQKVQAALAQLGPHVKGAPRDPQGRQEAMKVLRQVSTSSALKVEDRDVLARDFAALKAASPKRK